MSLPISLSFLPLSHPAFFSRLSLISHLLKPCPLWWGLNLPSHALFSIPLSISLVTFPDSSQRGRSFPNSLDSLISSPDVRISFPELPGVSGIGRFGFPDVPGVSEIDRPIFPRFPWRFPIFPATSLILVGSS